MEVLIINRIRTGTSVIHRGRSVRGKFSKINSNNGFWMSKYLRMSVYKRQKFRKIVQAKVGWRRSFKLKLALAQ